MDNELFKGYGIEITLPSEENFLKVKETLTRIGVTSRKDNTLYQSCHILHKRGRYVILHFKELFLLDGKQSKTNLTDDDIQRRNTITSLLEEWGLVQVVDAIGEKASMKRIKIVPYREKGDWNFVAKYTVGNSNKKE